MPIRDSHPPSYRAGSTIQGTSLRRRNLTRHGRTRIILGDLLDLLSDFEAAHQFHQLQRFVEAGGNAAPGDAVAINDKTGMALDYFDRRKPRQARHEGPMGGDIISIQQLAAARSRAPSQTDVTQRAFRLRVMRKLRYVRAGSFINSLSADGSPPGTQSTSSLGTWPKVLCGFITKPSRV